MPIFRLNDQILFPHPDLAEDNGLLAVGGDLSPERLLTAYRFGIFPWYSPGDPLLWWFISPRLVIFVDEFHVPKRVARYRKKASVTITRDCAFTDVINECASVRTETGDRTWISPEIRSAFEKMHELGYAHSFECWQGEQLVGGLYGIALGRVFFGESMFSRIPCASQFALIALVEYLRKADYALIDCQMTTDHLLRFGAREISGKEFQHLLQSYIVDIKPQTSWKHENKSVE